MRFLFIPSDGRFCGDLLEIFLCRDCKTPNEFEGCHIASPRYPRAELGTPTKCFICSKHFDGNTPATEVIIELNQLPKRKNNE
jgi:hypothetical protein